jgi:hypothetical protein
VHADQQKWQHEQRGGQPSVKEQRQNVRAEEIAVAEQLKRHHGGRRSSLDPEEEPRRGE